MKNRVAVVTGSSSGFGKLTALELARQGYLVVATMRDLTKSDNLLTLAKEQGVIDGIKTYELDVTSSLSIDNWLSFMREIGRVDVLINNAGYAGAGFVEEIPLEEYKKQFDTNVFGVIEVTQAVLPMMRTQGSGKIINVSSISGKIAFPGLSPYVASKHALEGWSESLRLELKPFEIDVVLVEPGSYQTSIWSSGKQVTEKSTKIESPYYETMKKLETHIEGGANQFGDPQDVAKLIATIAKKKQTTLRYPIGKGIKTTIILKSLLPWKLWERIVLKQIK